jgi:2-phosphosulfolactate phosphatase
MPKIVCDWGLAGIEAWKGAASVFVIVDVLSFSTSVSIAVERGATVFPFPYGDQAAADAEARQKGAIAASPRRAGGGQLSLSPVSLRQLQPGSRVVLPSPNGSRLSLATGGVPTICGCLRNAGSVAQMAEDIAGDGTIAVIAAGERWPDQTLRPAIEDWLGAGAIIRAVRGDANAEAELAQVTCVAAGSRLADMVRGSRSGRELAGWGYCEDVEVALEACSTSMVPVMRDGAYEAG